MRDARNIAVLVACLILRPFEAVNCTAQDRDAATKLIFELGCSGCHTGIPEGNLVRDKAPDLSYAGLRFNSAYLFDYLQNPTKVRHNIDPSRMPDFGFDEKESLALVLFLEKQVQAPAGLPEYPSELTGDFKESRSVSAGKRQIDEYECTKCHALEGEGVDEATDLSSAGFRLNTDWTRMYLAAPHIYDGSKTAMPSFFYTLGSDGKQFTEMLPQAGQQINDIAVFLSSLNKPKKEELWKLYEKAKTVNPDIDAELGERIFGSQNCVACHKVATPNSKEEKNGPGLEAEGVRVKEDWLRAYLKKPTAIRPFGFQPGSGSRMPDFNLSDEEIDILTQYFLKRKVNTALKSGKFISQKLSVFSKRKAETLLKDKLPCLGCHQLGADGGRVAPNLSHVKSRLQDDYVYELIQNPQKVLPGTVMPKAEMPQAWLSLVASYLLQAEMPESEPGYLRLTEYSTHAYEENNEGKELYLNYCASCHGIGGDGDGFNARYLPTEPTSHADSVFMSTRPDDTLFDAIFAGGAILNKSHRMPGWGATLAADDIWKLVAYLRDLCQCEGPQWSRDNKASTN